MYKSMDKVVEQLKRIRVQVDNISCDYGQKMHPADVNHLITVYLLLDDVILSLEETPEVKS